MQVWFPGLTQWVKGSGIALSCGVCCGSGFAVAMNFHMTQVQPWKDKKKKKKSSGGGIEEKGKEGKEGEKKEWSKEGRKKEKRKKLGTNNKHSFILEILLISEFYIYLLGEIILRKMIVISVELAYRFMHFF